MTIYISNKMVVINELPTDVLMNIQSFLIGKPEQIKIKNNKKFHKLQRLFKINYIYIKQIKF